MLHSVTAVATPRCTRIINSQTNTIAWETRVHESRIVLLDHSWTRFAEIQELYFSVLYREFGVPRGADWYHDANGSTFAVALDTSDRVIGAARLLPAPGDPLRQVRQVAVASDAHGNGLGRRLLLELEALAEEQGARELWLNSRDSAYGFYERIGFSKDGQEFESELTGIMHTCMRKRLGSA